MSHQQLQTAIVQTSPTSSSPTTTLPLAISQTVPVPELPTVNHVLIRVLAVALNPIDHKMVTHFPSAGSMVGCDFCGVVEKGTDTNAALTCQAGTRVCGSIFPYAPSKELYSGAFAEWVVADARLLLRVPSQWDDLQGAALGGVGWGTVALAMSDPDALALEGRPSKPTLKKEPVLVYGGATATGTMACQLLKRSGYSPIAVTSPESASVATEYGAAGTAAYTSPSCGATVRELAGGVQIRHALDCITNVDSAAICFAAIARTGGRYACLEGLDEAWRTRRAVRVKEVMGFEALGVRIDLGSTASTYSREANQHLLGIGSQWAKEMQGLLDAGLIKTHPIQEVAGCWDGIIVGLGMLQRSEVKGRKLVVRINV